PTSWSWPYRSARPSADPGAVVITATRPDTDPTPTRRDIWTRPAAAGRVRRRPGPGAVRGRGEEHGGGRRAACPVGERPVDPVPSAAYREIDFDSVGSLE